MNSISQIVGLFSMILGQVTGISSQAMALRQQQQYARQQQVQTCPYNQHQQYVIVNGQQALVCVPNS